MRKPVDSPTLNIGTMLIRYRVRYYFTALGALLRRQWQWLLLI